MILKHSIFLLLSILFTYSYAQSLEFALVSPNATTVSVIVDGTAYLMTRKYEGVPYFTATVALTSMTSYKYTSDGVQETFDRTFPEGRTKTYNDFFQRETTVHPIRPLGQAFPAWDRALGPHGVFNDDYVSTIVFVGEWADFVFKNISRKEKVWNLTVAMINKEHDVFFTDGIDVNIQDTSQMKPNMKIQHEDNYRRRKDWKLRPSVSDPVFIRDKLYNDMLTSLGCPHVESGWARVYVNDKPLGFYHLQEKAGSRQFNRQQFYGQKVERPEVEGTPLDASTGADFWVGTNIDSFEAPGSGTNTGVLKLIQALADLDVNDDAALAYFDANWWSMEHFYRAMALEFLGGHYDSYWFHTTNFVIFDDTTEGEADTMKYYFIDQDFDQTLGVNLATNPLYNPYGANYTRIWYTEFVNKTWGVNAYDSPVRAMVDKLMSTPKLKARFEQVLYTTVQKMYNPLTLFPKIDALQDLVRPHIMWDIGLGLDWPGRAHPGMPYYPGADRYAVVFTEQDFENGMWNEIQGTYGLKQFITEKSQFIAEMLNITEFVDPLEEGATTGTVTPVGSTTGSGIPASSTTGPVAGSVTTGQTETTENLPPTEGSTTDSDSVSAAGFIQSNLLFILSTLATFVILL